MTSTEPCPTFLEILGFKGSADHIKSTLFDFYNYVTGKSMVMVDKKICCKITVTTHRGSFLFQCP